MESQSPDHQGSLGPVLSGEDPSPSAILLKLFADSLLSPQWKVLQPEAPSRPTSLVPWPLGSHLGEQTLP